MIGAPRATRAAEVDDVVRLVAVAMESLRLASASCLTAVYVMPSGVPRIRADCIWDTVDLAIALPSSSSTISTGVCAAGAVAAARRRAA